MRSSVEFLPENIRAGLSSPAPAARAFLYLMLSFVLVLVAMVCFGRLDRTAIAHGRLIPAGHSRMVQAPLGGIVRQVRVSEGQRVEAGDDLVVMVEQASNAGHQAAALQWEMSKLELSRVEAQLEQLAWSAPPDAAPELAAKVGARHRVETEAQAALEQQEAHALRRLSEDRQGAEAVVTELSELAIRHRAEEQAMARLIEKGHVSKLQVLAKERERISAEQQLVAAQHRLVGAREAVEQQTARVRAVRSNYLQRLESERIELVRSVQDRSSQLVEAQLAVEAARLRAPVSGVVVDLVAVGAGQVFQPGQAVVTIVPDDQSLHAEVWLENGDASQVEEGQLARLKVMAVDFRKYGAIDAEVVQVAADATLAPMGTSSDGSPIADPALPNHAFKARIVPGAQVLGRSFGSVKLRPGMRVTAEIVVGTRSVLDYLLSPVVQTLDEAGKET